MEARDGRPPCSRHSLEEDGGRRSVLSMPRQLEVALGGRRTAAGGSRARRRRGSLSRWICRESSSLDMRTMDVVLVRVNIVEWGREIAQGVEVGERRQDNIS